MKFLHEVCSLPTAPFVEKHVAEYLRRFVKARKGLKLSEDQFGNLLIALPGKKKALPRLVFTAHMDHPGLVAAEESQNGMVSCFFRGGVLTEYVIGARVRFFVDGLEFAGKIVSATSDDKDRAMYPDRCLVKIRGDIKAGSPGMFDLGEGQLKGKRFLSRAIDDLGGLAAALAAMDQLYKRPPASTIALLCTRAEEDGFIGAIAASVDQTLLRKTDRIIAIECSAKQAYAQQGLGMIIRTGDKTSIFNSALTYWMTQIATSMAEKKAISFQRALMPGGTCEATVYDLYGYTSAAVCIALGNYHNMDREKKKLAPEYIDVDDWNSMVKLFVQMSKEIQTFDPSNAMLKERLEKRFDRLKHLFASGKK